MDLGLANARVIVTGGASNIGRGIVHGFATEGSAILICDLDGEQANKVGVEAMNIGAAEALVAELDLTEAGAGARLVGQALDRWGGVDVLVNNAGWGTPRFIVDDTDRANWQRTVEVSLYSAMECTQAVIAPMREAGSGSVIFVSSDAAFGDVRQGIYGTTKAALVALSKAVAKEHGRDGIRSNAVCPGLVLPDSNDAVGAKSMWSAGRDNLFTERQIDYLLRRVPLGRLPSADDVAKAVVWMSSERAALNVTGQTISVSGGYSMQ